MIYFLATGGHKGTFTHFLRDRVPDFSRRFTVVAYDQLLRRESIPRGSDIFGHLDRLTPVERDLAGAVHQQLSDAGIRLLSVAEEPAILRDQNEHKSWVRDVFSFANIDCGRIDDSNLNGRPQVWEINDRRSAA